MENFDPNKRLHEVFTKALKILGKNGENWIKGAYDSRTAFTDHGEYCLIGACAKAANVSPYDIANAPPGHVLDKCIKLFREPYNHSPIRIVDFNDNAKFSDVRAVLKCAIDKTKPISGG